MRAGLLGITSAAIVASADEIHQMFLPTRGASFNDVLLDTSGALALNLTFFAFLAYRRNQLMHEPITTLRLSLSVLPQRVSRSREVQGIMRSSARGVAALERGVRRSSHAVVSSEGASKLPRSRDVSRANC